MGCSLKLRVNQAERGFSLVEIMVSLALLGIVSMGMASFFTSQLQQQRSLVRKYEIISLRDAITSALADPAVCQCQFSPIQVSATQVTGVPAALHLSCAATSPVLVEATKKVPGTQTGLEVTTITAKTEGTVTLGQRVKLNYIVDFKPEASGLATSPISISKIVTTSATGAVTGCIAEANSLAGICASMRGTFNESSQQCTLPTPTPTPTPTPITNSGWIPLIGSAQGFNCLPGSAITGFAPDGKARCTAVSSGSTVTVVQQPVNPTPTPTSGASASATPVRGTVVGWAACALYVYPNQCNGRDATTCQANDGGCGVGATSTWSFHFPAQSGSPPCASPYVYIETATSNGGVTGFQCLQP